MKAFTVYQPYAFAIVAGLKGYETKSRRTNIRGRVAVHAGAAKFDAAMKTRPQEVREKIAELQHESPFVDNVLHRGAVIGTVEIVDCVPVEEIMHTLTERERLLGDYSPGRFAWVLQNPVMFDTPTRAKGQQGWWEWDDLEAYRELMSAFARDLNKLFRAARETARRTYWDKRLGKSKEGENT